MAFQIRCPSCQKLYAAEERMVGRKIRCRNCNNVFVVEAPAAETVPSPATTAGEPEEHVHQLDPSNLTGTRKAMTVPPAEDQEPYEFKDLKPKLRPSMPQQFPGSLVVEAWLPLALALVAAVWSVSETFGQNDSGKGWVPLVRIGVAAGFYLLFIAPVTFATVKKNFNEMHRLLPPSPRLRTAATFAMPACFAYVFWTSFSSVGSLLTGLILGLVFMAAVFWLVMRLDPQEAATAYSWACGAFLVTVGVSAGIVVGANALLDQWMIKGHAETYTQSPLGSGLAWTTPEPERPHLRRAEPPAPSQNLAGQETGPSTTQPGANSAVANDTAQPSNAVTTVPASMPSTDTNSSKPKEVASDIFVSPDKDPFAIKIDEAKIPWVKRVTCPSGSVFDSTISPLAPSPNIGLITTDNGLKFKVAQVAGGYSESVTPVALPDVTTDPQSICDHYALSADGAACIRMNEFQLQVIATGETRQNIIGFHVPPQTGGALLQPSLIGVIRNDLAVVRWSAPQTQLQFVQRYSYGHKGPPSSVAIMDTPASPDAVAVSANPEDQIWFAALVQTRGKPTVKIYNITSKVVAARGKPPTLPLQAIRPAPMPMDVDPAQFERAEIAFSPNGKEVALLLEQGDSGRVIWWSIGTTIGTGVEVSCKVPTQAEAGGKHGRSLQWLGSTLLIVHGRTIINIQHRGVLGELPATGSILSEQVLNDNSFAVTYAGPDGHPHLDVVELDMDMLMTMPLKQ